MYSEIEMKAQLVRDHCQKLQQEAANNRVLASIPGESGIGRRVAGSLGRMLVSVGTRLEQVERHGKPVIS